MTPASVLLLAAGAVVATLALGPVTMAGLRRFAVVDVPNHRSSHEVATLRGGGVSVLAGIAVTVAGAAALGLTLPVIALSACVLLAGLGLLADVTDIGPLPRIVTQALVGAAAGSLLGDWKSALLGAIAVPVLVNAVNFMDGINGITGLTMSAWAMVTLVGARTDGAVVLAALALGGAVGFLPWNVPRARMFLGDVGSYLFGGLVATALLVEQSGGGRPVLVLAPLLPYLLDTGLTLVRRAARGARLTEAHREHFYQRLSRRPAWSHVGVASLTAVASLATGSVGLLALGQNGLL